MITVDEIWIDKCIIQIDHAFIAKTFRAFTKIYLPCNFPWDIINMHFPIKLVINMHSKELARFRFRDDLIVNFNFNIRRLCFLSCKHHVNGLVWLYGPLYQKPLKNQEKLLIHIHHYQGILSIYPSIESDKTTSIYNVSTRVLSKK